MDGGRQGESGVGDATGHCSSGISIIVLVHVHNPEALPVTVQNKNLTSTQERALSHYRRLTEQGGEPPTVRALGAALGVSPNAAQHLIQKLREKGYLTMKPVTIIRSTLTAKGRRAK